MALDRQVGSFTLPDGGAGTQKNVDVPFPPLALFFFWVAKESAGDGIEDTHAHVCFGFANSPSGQAVAAWQARDGVGSSDTNYYHSSKECLCRLSEFGVTADLWKLVALNSTGFVLEAVDPSFFSSTSPVPYLALGGSDLADTAVKVFTEPASAGTQDLIFDFQPDSFWLISAAESSAPSGTGGGAQFCVGVATRNPSGQFVYASHSRNAQPATDSDSYCRAGECIALISSTGVLNGRATVDSYLANGIRLNWLEASGGRKFYCLALKGGSYVSGSLLTQTATGVDIQESGFGFPPSGGIFVSHAKSESAQDALQAHGELSIGAWDSPSNQRVEGAFDEDSASPTNCSVMREEDEVYTHAYAPSSIEGLMKVKSVESDGFTCTMDDPDPSGSFVWYWAIGNALGGQLERLLTEALSGSFSDSVARVQGFIRSLFEDISEFFNDTTPLVQQYARSLVENISSFFVDAVARAVVLVRSVPEDVSASFADSLSRVRSALRSISEDVSTSFSDSASRISGLARAVSESISVPTDAVARAAGYARSAAENIASSFVDSLSRVAGLVRTATENLATSFSDSIFRAAAYFRSTSEDVSSSFVDTIARVIGGAGQQISRLVTEDLSAAFSDSVSRVVGFWRKLYEDISEFFNDTTPLIANLTRTLIEDLSASFVEAVGRSTAILRSASENISSFFADIVSGIVGAQEFIRSVSEDLSASFSDAVARSASYLRSVLESVSGLTDAVARRVTYARSAALSISASFADAVTRAGVYGRLLTLSVSGAFSDALSKTRGSLRSLTEDMSGSFADTVVRSALYVRTLSFSIAASFVDSVDYVKSGVQHLARVVTEDLSASFSETVMRFAAIARSVSEALPFVGDVVARRMNSARILIIDFGAQFADSLGRARRLSRGVLEDFSASFSDTLSRLRVLIRHVTEALSLSDSLSRGVSYSRSLSEGLDAYFSDLLSSLRSAASKIAALIIRLLRPMATAEATLRMPVVLVTIKAPSLSASLRLY